MANATKSIEHDVKDDWGLLLAETLPNLVFLSSQDAGAISYANRAWQSYVGATREPSSWLDRVHTDDLSAARAAWDEAQHQHASHELELRLRRADGAYRWHLLRLTPFSRQIGESFGWLASATDINDRHHAEEVREFFAESISVLSESLNYTQNLRKLTDLLVPWMADICCIEVLNDEDDSVQRLEIAGTDPAKASVASGLHLRSWLAYPGSSEKIGEMLTRGQSVFLPDIMDQWLAAAAPDAEQVAIAQQLAPCSAILVPLRARDRTLGALVLATTDSGRRYSREDLGLAHSLGYRAGIAIDNARLYAASRRAARQLREANRARDEFLGLMSHELRTPVTTIYGNANVLQRMLSNLGSKELAAAVDDISGDADRLRLIIENLLVLARHRQQDDVEPLMMGRLVESARLAHKRSHPARQINVSLSGEGVCVTANADYVELVLRNLLNNAEKYSPVSKAIDLTIERLEGEVVVTIQDRGHGIPDEEMEDIFQPFFRSEGVRNRVSGVGIGLTVCKHLIEAQGGRIWASTRKGGGLELAFALPVEEDVEAGV